MLNERRGPVAAVTRRERTFRVLGGIVSGLALYVVVQEGTGIVDDTGVLGGWSLLIGMYLLVPLFALYAIGGQRAVDPVMGWLMKVAELRDRLLERLIRRYIVLPPEPEHLLPRRKRAAAAQQSHQEEQREVGS